MLLLKTADIKVFELPKLISCCGSATSFLWEAGTSPVAASREGGVYHEESIAVWSGLGRADGRSCVGGGPAGAALQGTAAAAGAGVVLDRLLHRRPYRRRLRLDREHQWGQHDRIRRLRARAGIRAE